MLQQATAECLGWAGGAKGGSPAGFKQSGQWLEDAGGSPRGVPRRHLCRLPVPLGSPIALFWCPGPRSQGRVVIPWVRCGGNVTLVGVREPATQCSLWLQGPEATNPRAAVR